MTKNIFMPLCRPLYVALLVFSLGFCFSLGVVESLAQTPTPQQLQQFQQLSPQQQDRIFREYGFDPAQIRQSTGGSQPGSPATSPGGAVEEIATDDKQPNEQISADPEDLVEEEKSEKTFASVKSGLIPFGYNLFAGSPTTFAPVTSIPIPSDYRIGPDDNIRIQLYGNRNEFYNLVVSRDGTIDLPMTGPKVVTGMSFDDLRSQIQTQVSHQYIGTQANVTLGELRSIQIFVLGEARKPGAYTVSSLSTMTNALLVSGGVAHTGSLRSIQHMRNGEVLGEFDLYDLLLRGDTTADKRLLPGDVIFIPPLKTVVGIRGEVRRPAIYELKDETTIADLVVLAGGYTSEAFPQRVEFSRIDAQWSAFGQIFDVSRFESNEYRLSAGRRIESILNLNNSAEANMALRMGDLLTIERLDEFKDGFIELAGETYRAGRYAWHRGMRMADLLVDLKLDLTPLADPDYAILVRETPDLRYLQVFDFNLRDAVENTNSMHNLELMPDDRVKILTKAANQSRKQQLNQAVNQVRNQTGRPVIIGAHVESAESFILLNGEVSRDGRYPWRTGLRISDVIGDLDFDLSIAADLKYALLVRQNPDRKTISVFDFNPIQAISAPGSDQDLQLDRRDELVVLSRSSSEQREAALRDIIARLQAQTDASERSSVFNISGAVRFPGRYPLTAGATLLDAFRAGGGLREHALVNEGEIIRMTQDARGITDVEIIAFHPEEIITGSTSIALQERDRILVKAMPEFDRSHSITLAGEVLYPGTYSFRQGETLKDVVERAGGLTVRAFPEGAVFTRERLRALERQRLAEAERHLRADLANLELGGDRLGGEQQTTVELQRIIDQLVEAEAVGRLVINLQDSLAGKQVQQIVLNDGDRLTVPPISQSVSVFGEIQFPASHLYQPSLTIDSYLERSGGPTRAADVRRVYVIHADGSVSLPRNSRWFAGRATTLRSGDTVVMPIKLDRINQLQLLTNVTQILSQLAFSAAALNSL